MKTKEDPARIALIAGPTGAGKTRLALAFADHLQARGSATAIVNADAIQVYRDLRILSARPSEQEMGAAPHRLFGHVDAARRYSVGDWVRDVEEAFAQVEDASRAIIIVGGTGLYFRALTRGLSPIPAVPDEIRRDAEARLADLGPAAFRAEVLRLDPAMARLEPNDAQRHLRAWAVATATGRPLSEHQAEPGRPVVSSVAARIALEPPRAALYATCDQRFDHMLAAGAQDEAAAIRARGLDPGLPAMKALGLPELIAAIEGRMTLDQARDAATQATRRFAKRQLTWFRNQTPDWPRAASLEEAFERLLEQHPCG